MRLEWCIGFGVGPGHGEILLADVKCFFIHYYVVKVYDYVELEIKLIL